MKVIDLTHTIYADMPVFPGTEPPIIEEANTLERDGFNEVKLTMYSHTGTHIDAPAHMLKEGLHLDDLSIEHFMGRAAVIDFSHDKIQTIDFNGLKQYDEKIKTLDFLILKTGWSEYWGRPEYYTGFPSLTEEAARYLSKFNLKGIGIDAISIDDISSTTFTVHKILMPQNIIIIENLTNLDAIKDEYFILSILPLKTNSADGSPVRAAAILQA